MSIAGHVSRQMLSHYSHIRTEAKRRAVEVLCSPPQDSTAEATKLNRETVTIHQPNVGCSPTLLVRATRMDHRPSKPITYARNGGEAPVCKHYFKN